MEGLAGKRLERNKGEGGWEGNFPCFSLVLEKFRFIVPPAVALLNFQRSSKTFADFS
jgi:hypothetical protein